MPIKYRGALFLLAAIAAVATFVLVPALRVPAFVVATAFLFAGMGVFGVAGRTAATLQTFRGADVHARVWGEPLPELRDARLHVESVKAVGVGLLIYLRERAGARRTLLKVAQPGGVTVTADNRVEIREASYVQWAGRRIAKRFSPDSPALVLEKVTDAA